MTTSMDRPKPVVHGVQCPMPQSQHERVQLGHGSGGRMSLELLRDCFLPHFANDVLARLGDAATVDMPSGQVAISTDTFVVQPLEFPGGNIGSLAVHGTLNDIAMMGARPRYLTAGFVLEEGLHLDVLDRILSAMARASREAGVLVVAGDTKVAERGKADGIFVNTTGVGEMTPGFMPAPHRAQAGDTVIVSGPVGRHGIAVMAARNELGFEAEIESDSANLSPLVNRLGSAVGDSVHVLRDPTRGGLASALNEIATSSRVGIELDEAQIPVPGAVSAACEMLGLDPLYVASEGVLVAIVDPAAATSAVATMQTEPLGERTTVIGKVVTEHAGLVTLKTGLGVERVIDMIPGDQLPRIC
ncbi:MAG: hydrogenase expression/formation protein HypE [Gemmatimonadales bacterium]|nr:hydrogenase expression/formation protein HypE [Gemmatimonadales bacterium]